MTSSVSNIAEGLKPDSMDQALSNSGMKNEFGEFTFSQAEGNKLKENCTNMDTKSTNKKVQEEKTKVVCQKFSHSQELITFNEALRADPSGSKKKSTSSVELVLEKTSNLDIFINTGGKYIILFEFY